MSDIFGNDGGGIGNIDFGSSSGIDGLFEREPQLIQARQNGVDQVMTRQADFERPTGMRRVASLRDLVGFTRTASDTLIHKSTQDFWSLQKGDDGGYYISRLVEGTGPVKENS